MQHNTAEQLKQINQQLKELVGIYRGAVSHCGISENEFWIWYALVVMGGDYSQQEICGMWSLSKQTVNTIINHMVKKEYVTLELIPGTRNRKRIRLTDAGRAYGESLVLPISRAEQRALERLPQEDRAVCTALLAKYIHMLREEIYGTTE